MRDYKNVKVPRKYRTAAKRVSVKRTGVRRKAGGPGKNASRLKRGLLKALLLAVAAGAGWLTWETYGFLLHAQMFQVAGVDVKGVRQLSEADVKSIAAFFTGQNIFRVDLAAAARRAQANPWVKEVRIQRSLPNRISITFSERIPYAVFDNGADRYLMDSEGTIIDRIVKDASSEWPLPVVAIRNYRPSPGETVTQEGMADALALLAEISFRGGWNVSDVMIRADSPETLSVVYAGHEFKVGKGNYGEKLRRLAEIIADVKERDVNIAYVDLRPERQAAVMVVKKKGEDVQHYPDESKERGEKIPSNKNQRMNIRVRGGGP